MAALRAIRSGSLAPSLGLRLCADAVTASLCTATVVILSTLAHVAASPPNLLPIDVKATGRRDERSLAATGPGAKKVNRWRGVYPPLFNLAASAITSTASGCLVRTVSALAPLSSHAR